MDVFIETPLDHIILVIDDGLLYPYSIIIIIIKHIIIIIISFLIRTGGCTEKKDWPC